MDLPSTHRETATATTYVGPSTKTYIAKVVYE